MKQTTAPITTPSPTKVSQQGSNKPKSSANQAYNPTSQFLGAALNMSWQLAIVVLVPILVGSQLDKRLDLSPTMTVIGFIVAMAGTGVIMWRQLQIYGNGPTAPKPKTGAKS